MLALKYRQSSATAGLFYSARAKVILRACRRYRIFRLSFRSASGFTLTEVLAAIAILSIGLSILLSTMSYSLHQLAQAEKMAAAASLAQSLLARIGAELPIREGESEGPFPNGYHWHLAIRPYGDAKEREAWPVGAYTISARITWEDGQDPRSFSLTTLRLGPKEPRK